LIAIYWKVRGDNIPKGGNTFWDGKSDDRSIYNKALTQQEITYLGTH